MKKTGKITIKHFLNTNLKPRVKGKSIEYPLYVSIWFQNKLTKVRSYWRLFDHTGRHPQSFSGPEMLLAFESEINYFTEKKFNEYSKLNPFKEELIAIETTVKLFHERYQINILDYSPGSILDQTMQSLDEIISKNFRSELKELLLELVRKKNDDLFSVITIIDWTRPFMQIYDVLFYISNDGKKTTKFYDTILSQFDFYYQLMTLLYKYQGSKHNKVQYWQWMKDEDGVIKDLEKFLVKNKTTTETITRMLPIVKERLDQHTALLETSFK